MATRSAIGIKHGPVIKAIYCHWDGYLNGVGRILLEHYQSSPKVNKLISLGDLSSIGPEIGSADNNTGSSCLFYGRDLNEAGTEHRVFENEESFLRDFNSNEEYYYLYDNGVWYYASYKNKTFEKLEYGLVMEALTA